jgi:hypothetical protein
MSISPDFIRAPGCIGLRNHFSSFRLEFHLDSVSPTAIHLFADNRYRLFVNEHFVAYGPARFVTQFPRFDSLDLTPWLETGDNQIRVEINFYGTGSFQTMPDGMPGWIAWGGSEDGILDLSTPGEWRCLTHSAWDAESPHFSFAQNTAELLDTRVLDRELKEVFSGIPEIIPSAERPWGELETRETPLPDYAPMHPARLLLKGAAKNELKLVGFQSFDSEKSRRDLTSLENKGPDNTKIRLSRGFLCWMHVTGSQSLDLHGFWGKLFLNGDPLRMRDDASCGNHGVFTLPLRDGWNLLTGHIEMLEEAWSWLMGWDKEKEICVRARPDFSEKAVFYLSPLSLEAPELPGSVSPEGFHPPADWTPDSGDPLRVTPARLAAWDLPVPGARQLPPGNEVRDLLLEEGQVRLLCFDFQDEYYGQPRLVVVAPEGTILDLSYDDWLRDDGCVNLYNSNPYVNATDRFILKGGRQEIEVLNPRGGIFLQAGFRLPPGAEKEPVTLHELYIRSRQTLRGHLASFDAGDPVLNWAVAKSHHTLAASTDEAFADCPWRERGTYIGDGRVNVHLLSQMNPDLCYAANFLRMFARSQLSNGQLPACTPSWLRRPHEDFSLIWVLTLHDTWAMTGDLDLVRELWPAVMKLWYSPHWNPGPEGLWNADGKNVFVDWGCDKKDKKGAGNTCLNVFRVAAARDLATLANQLSLTDEAERFAKEAEDVTRALLRHLWISEEERFAPFEGGSSNALHANILALRFGVGDPAALLRYLEPLLRDNFQRGIDFLPGESHAELYFFSYLFPALAENGRVDLVLELIQTHYGFLMSTDCPTLNECFFRTYRKIGSCCHSWSGAPALFAVPWIAGLRQREPGNPLDWELSPPPPAFEGDRIEVNVASRLGMIHVVWKRGDKGFVAEVSAPDGIRIHQ